MYSDASPKGYGIAVMGKDCYMQLSGKHKVIPGADVDNNKMELNSILLGLKLIYDTDSNPFKKVIVFTDSAAAKEAIEKGLLANQEGWWDVILAKFQKENSDVFKVNQGKMLMFVKLHKQSSNNPFHLRIMRWCDYHSRSDKSFLSYTSELSI